MDSSHEAKNPDRKPSTAYTVAEKKEISRFAAMHPGLLFEELHERFGYPTHPSTLTRWMSQYPYYPDGTPYRDCSKRHRFTSEEKSEILDELFAEDPVDINEFARKVHISPQTLSRWARGDPRYSVGTRYAPRYPDEFKEEVMGFLAGNPEASVYKAARKFGVSARTVSEWARRCGQAVAPPKRQRKYSHEERERAVMYVRAHPHVTAAEAMSKLGYPDDPQTLRNWLGLEARSLLNVRQTFTIFDRIAIVDLFETSEDDLESFCLKHSLNPSTLKNWVAQFRRGGYVKLMRRTDLPRKPDEIPEADKDERIRTLEFELDVARSIIEVLKKDPGLNGGDLTNREKVEVIDALRPFYKLSRLLEAFRMAKSSYFYTKNALMRGDKYADLRPIVVSEFADSGCEYGYRRIWYRLRYAHGLIVSEKVVRRIMREEELVIRCRKRRRYSSYKGQVGKIAPNMVMRNFRSDEPRKKLLTDITEFHVDDYKVYLSAMVDCFNGECVGYSIGESPTMDLVLAMLDQASEAIGQSKPIVHSDQGWHYQNGRYVGYLAGKGWRQSMSRKGCSPDNAAMEGFFGVLKRCFFYVRSFDGVEKEAFATMLSDWIDWFNTERVKMPLGGLSPVEYRLEYEKRTA